MSNTRILYHGTTMENAITMLGSNFSSIVDETVWNCSDDDMLYMAEKDYDGEENEGLRIAAEAAQIAAAYLGSESSDLVVLKLEIPEFMFEEAYVTEDDSCDNMYGCWQIKQNDLKKILLSRMSGGEGNRCFCHCAAQRVQQGAASVLPSGERAVERSG